MSLTSVHKERKTKKAKRQNNILTNLQSTSFLFLLFFRFRVKSKDGGRVLLPSSCGLAGHQEGITLITDGETHHQHLQPPKTHLRLAIISKNQLNPPTPFFRRSHDNPRNTHPSHSGHHCAKLLIAASSQGDKERKGPTTKKLIHSCHCFSASFRPSPSSS